MPDFWTVLLALNTFGLYAAALVAFGSVLVGFAFTRILRRPYYRDLTVTWAVLGLLFSIADIALRAAALIGDLSGMIDPGILRLVLNTSAGDAMIWRAVGFGLLLLGALLGRTGAWIALSGGALVMCSFTVVGHIAEKSTFWLQLTLYFHLSAAAFWVGILGPLRRLAVGRDKLEEAAQLGHEFGRAAMVILPVLILAGGIMAWALLDTWAAVLSPYGLALLAKIATVALFLALGAINKTRHVPAMQKGDAFAAEALAQVIRKEQVALGLVLLVTTLLTVFTGIQA